MIHPLEGSSNKVGIFESEKFSVLNFIIDLSQLYIFFKYHVPSCVIACYCKGTQIFLVAS